MKRTISTTGLLLTSLSAIIGSGWLFSAYYTSILAGPGSILAWLLGGVFVLVIAFIFAEVCGMLPISGSSTRIPQLTHGPLVSFTFAWIIWLSYVSFMTIEVRSVLQYAAYYFPNLTYSTGGLTKMGLGAATVLMLLTSLINTYSVRLLIRANSFLTSMKVLILVLIGFIMLLGAKHSFAPFHPAHSVFLPMGVHGIFGALVGGGILFAFNGFKQAAEMAGEAKNPKRAVPLAILGSVLIAMALFLLLQIGFLNSLDGFNLTHGWGHLVLENPQSPFASVLAQNGQFIFMPVLYIGAIVAPLAAGLMYCSAASRSLYGMAKNGYAPAFLTKLSAHHHPMSAVVVNFVLGMFLFLPLPGWNSMVAFMGSLLAVTYAIGPLSLIALRHQLPDQHRPLRLPFGTLWAFVAFYICTLLTYWSGWDTLWKMAIALVIGFIIFGLYTHSKKYKKSHRRHGSHGSHAASVPHQSSHFKGALWLWPYLAGICVFSYLGDFGGHAYLSTTWEMFGQLIFSGLIFVLATKLRVPDAEALEQVKAWHLTELH